MSVICQCPSCKTKYQVGDQYAGRTVRCPKCSGAVVVPGAARPAGQATAASTTPPSKAEQKAASPSVSLEPELSDAPPPDRNEDPRAESAATISRSTKTVSAAAIPPADPVADERDADAAPADAATDEQDDDLAPPVDEGLGFLATGPAKPQQRTRPKPPPPPAVAEQSSGEDQPADDAADELAAISALAARSPKGVAPHRSKKKKKGFPAWLIATIAAVGAVTVIGIGSAIYLTSNSNRREQPERPAAKPGATMASLIPIDGEKSGKPRKPEKKVPVLRIDWPESQRVGATLWVNDDKLGLPLKGPIEVRLAPSNERYQIRLQRKGFQEQTFFVASHEDDLDHKVADWVVESKGIDWEQDFEAAKKTAAREHKNVLILFDASDSKESSFASSRFREAVAMRPEFRARAAKEYVCVYIDNPQNAETPGKVDDADRNRELTTKFHITIFPTVVATDPKGRPFGVLEDYKINGIIAFLELLDQWTEDGKTLLTLLAKIDKDGGNSDLAGKAIDFLEMNKLDRFYAHTIKKLAALLPKGEGNRVTKEAYEDWVHRFERATRNPDEVRKVVDEFDRWKKTRNFTNPDMAAALHLAAAFVLARLGPDYRKEAAQNCKEGLAFDPQDPRIRGLLDQFNQALTGEPGKPAEMPVGSGTGFCIAQGNYVLTNHHVIDGAKKIQIHLNGQKEKYPAKVIADNKDGDMALLKIELPPGRKLVPIPLAGAGLKIGEDVCAMGFPGVMAQNITLTLTKGIVSTIPGPDDAEGFIATDCKVNPGNSGGPLCDFSGNIAGMVTAKSNLSSKEDSYGLVIPVDRLRKFLAENLPAESRKLPPLPAKATNLKLSDLAEIVAPSVVYIENIQEMHGQIPGE